MISKFGVLVLVAWVYSASSTPLPPCTCDRQVDPVCGNDGVTYDNLCLLTCVDAQLEHHGECNTEHALPQCTCGKEAKPICGSDGKTYGNECLLNCATVSNPTLSISHLGLCETVDVPTSSPCTCGRESKPVCGSDGKTYTNECLLNCATATDPSLHISKVGPCLSSIKVVDPFPACNCPDVDQPACGSDGNTYMNDCLLKCESAKDPSLSVAHFGACENTELVDPLPPCICTRERKPVCGSDGKTYSNECLLNCAISKEPSLSRSHAGPCLTVKVVNPPCVCTREMKPVCGSDGKSYGNSCMLNCAAESDSQLRVARQGFCEDEQ